MGRTVVMGKRFKPVWLSVALAITSLSSPAYSAVTASQPSGQTAGFQIKPGPPPGFSEADVDAKQSTYVSVYYQGRLLLNTMASFNDNEIQFSDPESIANAIPNINDKPAVVKALAGNLNANANALCTNNRSGKPYCKIIQPKIAGVIFNSGSYQAYIFINPSYLSTQEASEAPLPPSDAGFSYLNSFNIVATKTPDGQSYTLTNTGVVAQNDNQLTAAVNVLHNSSAGINTNVLTVQNVAASRFSNNLLYQAGMLSTQGTEFISAEPVLGASVANTSNSSVSPFQVQGSPLDVYIPLPSQINIYRGSSLIYTAHLPAGKQEIDTSSFPIGAYNVSIQISPDNISQTTTQNQFFVKQPQLPTVDSANYILTVGMLQKNTFAGSTTIPADQSFYIPSYSWIPIFNYYEIRKFTSHWGLTNDLISNMNRLFLSSDVNFYFDELEVSPGAMLSNNGDIGASLSSSLTLNRLSTNFAIAKIVPTSKTYNQIANGLSAGAVSLAGSNFNPLMTNTLTINTNVSYSFSKSSVGVGAFWTEVPGQNLQRNLNLTYNYNLWSTESTAGIFSLVATKANTDSSILASIQINFSTPTIFASVTGGENWIDSQSAGQSSERYNISGATINKQYTWDMNHDLNLGAQYNNNIGSKTYQGSMTYQSSLLNSNISVQNSENAGGGASMTTYNATLNSSFAYSGGHVGLGYNQSWLSGVIIDVKAPQSSDVIVYVDNSPVAVIKTNHPQSIFMQPYKTHTLSINPIGNTLYSYDRSPRTITIYQGNMKYEEWDLAKQYILFAKVVDQHNQPLPNLLLQSRNEFDTTDAGGYLQAGLDTNVDELHFRSTEGDTCLVSLPQPLKIEEGIVVLDKPLQCDLHPDASS